MPKILLQPQKAGEAIKRFAYNSTSVDIRSREQTLKHYSGTLLGKPERKGCRSDRCASIYQNCIWRAFGETAVILDEFQQIIEEAVPPLSVEKPDTRAAKNCPTTSQHCLCVVPFQDLMLARYTNSRNCILKLGSRLFLVRFPARRMARIPDSWIYAFARSHFNPPHWTPDGRRRRRTI